MNIFEYDNYKRYFKEFIHSLPKKGRGQFKLLGEYLGTGPVVISQIFNGNKDLTVDQGLLISKFYGYSPLETDFFLLLISYERAVHYQLKSHYEEKIKSLKLKALDIKKHLKEVNEFDDNAKQVFYSDWRYSAIRLTCGLKQVKTEFDIENVLNLPLNEIREILIFLKQYDLVRIEDGRLKLGKGTTFLDQDSPLKVTHRKNWRLKAFEKFSDNESLHYAAPMCISKNLAKKYEEKFIKVFQELSDEIGNEKPDTLMCLNLDFFKVE